VSHAYRWPLDQIAEPLADAGVFGQSHPQLLHAALEGML
jgi:hypothetical protein